MRSVAVILGILILSIGAFAQKTKSKEEYYKEIAALSNTKKPDDLEHAYQLSKEFVAKFPAEKGGNVDKIHAFIKRYRAAAFFGAIGADKTADAFVLGNEILAEEPENVDVMSNLAYAGYKEFITKQDQKYVADSIKFAQTTLALYDKGVNSSNYSPFRDKQDATAFMYFVMGNLTMPTDMRAGASYIYRSTQFESLIKSSEQAFALIAGYYEDAYQKLLDKRKTATGSDAKAIDDRIDKVVDLMLDAYARADQRAQEQNDPDKGRIRDRFVEIYKFRKKTDAGLDAYIKSVNATPMPDPGSFN